MLRAAKLRRALKPLRRVAGPKQIALAQVQRAVRLLAGLVLAAVQAVVRLAQAMRPPCLIHLHHHLVVAMMTGGRPAMLMKNAVRNQSAAANGAAAALVS